MAPGSFAQCGATLLAEGNTWNTPAGTGADELLPISQVDLKDGVFAGVVEQRPQLAGFRTSSEAT